MWRLPQSRSHKHRPRGSLPQRAPTTPGRSVYAIFGAWTLALSFASYNLYQMCGCIESKLAGVASGASTTCSILLLLNNIMVLKRCAGGFAGGSARGPMRPALPWPPPPSPPPLSDSTKPGGWDINFILMTLAAIYTTYLMVTECGCDEGKLAAFMNGLTAMGWLELFGRVLELHPSFSDHVPECLRRVVFG